MTIIPTNRVNLNYIAINCEASFS